MKVLTLAEALEAAEDSKMPGTDRYVHLLTVIAGYLADDMAKHLRIGTVGADHVHDDHGICVFFHQKRREKCPAVINVRDIGGDWELQPYESTQT